MGRDSDWRLLRCPVCVGELCWAAPEPPGLPEGGLECPRCAETFPVVNGVPRLLTRSMREALGGAAVTGVDRRQVATAASFGFEWQAFGAMHPEWEHSFFEYMAPHGPEFFAGKRVLDAGCGGGRHAFYAARYGAEVWAVDLSDAVEVARHNTRGAGDVYVVQGDVYQLPFAPDSFDLVYSLGVLHHLPEPERAFRNLLRYVKPGGELRVYLYWKPENQPVKRALLGLVAALRRVTTRLPHGLLYWLSYPLAAAAFTGFVWPYRVLRRVPLTRRLAEKLPLKQYAAYPFQVCVNDQFDRFSAPIENRYTRAEVGAWLERAGLAEPAVLACWGWLGVGLKPLPGGATLAGSAALANGVAGRGSHPGR